MRGVEPGEEGDADRNSNHRPKRERPCPPDIEGVAQIEDAIALREQTVTRDQGRGLRRRDDVQPYAGHHDAHREAGKSADEAADKGGASKESKENSIHGSLPPKARWRALGWSPSEGEAADPLSR